MQHRVIISPMAELDLRWIAGSIRERVSAESAKRWTARLRRAITDLGATAERYPEAEEAASLGRMSACGSSEPAGTFTGSSSPSPGT